MPLFRSRHMLIPTGALLVLAAPVVASADEGPIASVTVSGANIEAGTSIAVAGAVTYKFNSALGLGIELTSIPSLTPETPAVPQVRLERPSTSIFPPPVITPIVRYTGSGGRATIFTTNVRLEIPTTTTRVIPFVTAGGGLANVRDELELRVDFPEVIIQSFGAVPSTAPLRPIRSSMSQKIRQSTTDLALTLGGGASIRATEHLWFDADLRYFSLMGARDRNVGRFGGGVSYRF